MIVDWKREIGIAYLVKQKVAEADVNNLWPFHLPEVAATEESIENAERKLGFGFDPSLRNFLKHADGWKGFFQAVDLFGTSDFVGGHRKVLASELLESLGDIKGTYDIDKSKVLPIAVSMDDIDIFLLSRDNGNVYWFAGQMIDGFPNFDEWFLAMVDYNRREYRRMTGQLS